MNNTRRRFTPEFKSQAVELVRAGRPVAELAKDLNVSTSLLYKWARDSDQPAQLGSVGPAAVGEESVADELRRLRRHNADLQLENDILKKAAVILGTSPRPRGAK
ncbi:transposase [Verrucomicrobiales bacterium]|nr:transposase [Verrucomicrobiales bacterium]